MESLEEFTGSNDHSPIMKGKRTKRQRPSSPHGAAATSTSSTGGGDSGSGGGSGASGVSGVGGGGGGGGDVCSSIPSPTTSSEILSTSTEEDEDMANCLILLAQGLVRPTQLVLENEENKNGKFTTTIGKSEFYVYECKTCNRTFPSFQALGGHRASHKKPKTTIHGEEKRVLPVTPAWVVEEEEEEEEVAKINKISSILPPLLTGSANTKSPHLNNKSKVHECSICGSEFASGQALGGHMRRHRAPPNTRIPMTTVDSTAIVESEEELIGSNKGRNILSLDLNLPAPPEDDHHHHHHRRDSKFEFTPNKQHLVFSAPALVDCHY